MPYYAVTGVSTVELTYYVEADSHKDAIEKAAADHPFLHGRCMRQMNVELGGNFCIYPHQAKDIQWLKAQVTQRTAEQTKMKL